MFRSLLNIEPETDLGMYLGCTLKKGENRLKDGGNRKNVAFKHVATPSLLEDAKHPARAPCAEGQV